MSPAADVVVARYAFLGAHESAQGRAITRDGMQACLQMRGTQADANERGREESAHARGLGSIQRRRD